MDYVASRLRIRQPQQQQQSSYSLSNQQDDANNDDTTGVELRIPEDPEGRTIENGGISSNTTASSWKDKHGSDMNYDDRERLLQSSPSSSSVMLDSTCSSSVDASGKNKKASPSTVVSKTGLMVLLLLAVQNCSKNLLMRYVMKDRPKFLTSAAVLGSEFIKLTLSTCYILFIERHPPQSIMQFLKEDRINTLLLTVPASAYNLQMSLEYVALANLNAAVFSVLVQTKLLFTATFAAIVLRKRLKYVQVISLVLLTSGVMLCNLSNAKDSSSSSVDMDSNTFKGILATLGIALSSGFASVYTEKVIKAQVSATKGLGPGGGGITSSPGGKRMSVSNADGSSPTTPNAYGLAYTQVQLSLMSLVTIGLYACLMDFRQIVEYGLFYNFSIGAVASVCSSALGGLIVAAVLKYADSVLKGYATAMSVILTGVLSMMLFGTTLTTIYFMGIVNVVTAVILYNGKDLEHYVCTGGS